MNIVYKGLWKATGAVLGDIQFTFGTNLYLKRNFRSKYTFSLQKRKNCDLMGSFFPMLVNFTLTNFRCFRDEARFSMVAGPRFKTHCNALTPIPGWRSKSLLPLAALYGGNASGKSTLVEALKQMRTAVIDGEVPAYTPFELDESSPSQPTRFSVVILVDSHLWEYSFSYCEKKVCHEKLVRCTERSSATIFERDVINQSSSISRSLFAKKDEAQYTLVDGIISTTPSHKLSLVDVAQRGILDHLLRPIVNWFVSSLCIISASSRNVNLGLNILQHTDDFTRELAAADTGMEELVFHDVQEEAPEMTIHKSVASKMKGDGILQSVHDPSLLIIKEGDALHVKRCYSKYRFGGDREAFFNLSQESDGTRRLMHLLPILLDRDNSPRVFVIDELDRSLHTELSRYLIERHLDICASERERELFSTQLIFTTHDVMLMDPSLLRKDELWGVERRVDHSSVLIPFLIYKDIRSDTAVRKSYMEGRMGAVPQFLF